MEVRFKELGLNRPIVKKHKGGMGLTNISPDIQSQVLYTSEFINEINRRVEDENLLNKSFCEEVSHAHIQETKAENMGHVKMKSEESKSIKSQEQEILLQKHQQMFQIHLPQLLKQRYEIQFHKGNPSIQTNNLT